MNITPPDFVIILILTFFTFKGFRHGFFEEMGKLISIIGGFIISSKYHNYLIDYISTYINGNILQITISYLSIFILSVIVFTILIKIIGKFIELVILDWLNRLLGMLLGLIKGFLIISLFIFIIQTLPLKFDQESIIRQKLKEESIMYQICENVKEIFILTIPIDNSLKNNQHEIKEISLEKQCADYVKPII